MNCPILNKLVYKGNNLVFNGIYNNKEVAIKYLLDGDGMREAEISQIASQYVNTPSVEYVDTDQSISIDGVTYNNLHRIIFSWIPGVSLEMLIENTNINPESKKHIAIQMVDIVESLQKHCIIHSDMYPCNWMVDDNNIVYIIDFGISIVSDNPVIYNHDDSLTLAISLTCLMFNSEDWVIPENSPFKSWMTVSELKEIVNNVSW